MTVERYTVEHETRYAYTAPVSQSWQLARLTPRTLPWQRLVSHELQIEPAPNERRDEFDSFGNTVTHFGLHGAHRLLSVRMRCLVEVAARPAAPLVGGGAGRGPSAARRSEPVGPVGGALASAVPASAPADVAATPGARPAAAPVASQRQQLAPLPPAAPLAPLEPASQAHEAVPPAPRAGEPTSWESTREAIRRDTEPPEHLLAARMSEPTQLVPLSEAARVYAAASFGRGRLWFDAVHDLMQRIYADFEFEPGATTVSTSVDEVLYQRSGVCQDFAHLMLACLRGMGLPARYVSGYLLTEPPPGMPRLMGVDASHAWVAAFSPLHGWVEFDPTNNQLADQRYITLAWGADFADVVPLRGVILGGGDQLMDIEVSVIPT